ncbi:hypothetical protein H5T57_01275 [Candidatus Bipolaricaulota bacterium]|nr:hypothetical protein [Candidatus Bipolaricaulota bacterium]
MKTIPWYVVFFAVVAVLSVAFLVQAPSPPQDFSEPSPAVEPKPAQVFDIHGKRGVYLTAYVAANPQTFFYVLEQSARFGLNAVVVDIKNNNGEVCYASEVPLAKAIGAVRPVLDLPRLIKDLHDRGFYVILRQVVFYDPILAKYLGVGTAPWILPTVEVAVEYNLALAQEAAGFGVDEIQFDYVRFPDDGPIGPDYSGRCSVVENFLAKAKESLPIPISADVYGRVMWPWNARSIDPIGQRLEGIAFYVDVVSPMLYPSHFVEEELKDDPYGTVFRTMSHGKERVKTPLRPYLQAFAMAIPPWMTLSEYIVAQVRAAEATGADGYLFWNPRGDYSALWEALQILTREKARP